MEKSRRKINVLIADSQFLIVEGLKNVLSRDERFTVEGVYATMDEVKRKMEVLGDGILVIDIFSVDVSGIEEFKKLVDLFAGFKVLVMTNMITRADILELKKADFRNILYKTVDEEELLLGLDMCNRGKKYYSTEILDLLLEEPTEKRSMDESKTLTMSELEIVKLISQGYTTKEIAQRKHVSFHTVNTHRKNIFRKLGVSNVSEMVMSAIKSGWIDTIEYYI